MRRIVPTCRPAFPTSGRLRCTEPATWEEVRKECGSGHTNGLCRGRRACDISRVRRTGYLGIDIGTPGVRAAVVPPDGARLVVAHNTLLRLAVCSLLDLPIDRY